MAMTVSNSHHPGCLRRRQPEYNRLTKQSECFGRVSAVHSPVLGEWQKYEKGTVHMRMTLQLSHDLACPPGRKSGT